MDVNTAKPMNGYDVDGHGDIKPGMMQIDSSGNLDIGGANAGTPSTSTPASTAAQIGVSANDLNSLDSAANGSVLAATPSADAGQLGSHKPAASKLAAKATNRIDVDALMNRFQRKIGRNWDRYRDSLTHFLMGKLTRPELIKELNQFLTPMDIHSHNYLLLAILANTLREPPPGDDSGSSGWKVRGSNRKAHVDTPTEMLHREIMALPPRERRRIKNIARETKRPAIPVPAPCLIATRQAMLPHLPYGPDRNGSLAAQAAQANGDPTSRSASPAPKAAGRAGPQVQVPTPAAGAPGAAGPAVNGNARSVQRGNISPDTEVTLNANGMLVHPGRTSGPLMWTQDIIHSLDAPLAGETYSLPDDDMVGERMLGIALENGVIHGFEAGATDIMLAGLEQYLTTIMQKLVQTAAYRPISEASPLTAKDMATMLDDTPAVFGEMSAPLHRLRTHFLRNEDTATIKDLEPSSSTASRLPSGARASFGSRYSNAFQTPIAEAEKRFNKEPELEDDQDSPLWNGFAERPAPKKRTVEETSLLQNANKGKRFVQFLLSTNQNVA